MKKNYIKLMGSIMCAFSMIMTVALVTIGAQANDEKITYVKNVEYEQENTAPTAPEGYDREDGYLFAGWYEEGGDNKNAAGYSPVSEPVVGQSYVAKYVPSEVLGVKAQVSGQIVDNDTDKIQNNAVDNAIRFVTSLDSTEYNHIGFNIKIEGTSYNQDAATTKSVYKTVYGIGADKNNQMTNYYPNEEFHTESVYFKTYTFTTIPESAFDSDITVTPYWITLDGTRVDGPETAVKTVNYGRAWYYVDGSGTVRNPEAPVGTDSNPYTTLASAVAVETKLNPKLILKSDVTIDDAVSVARTMTIEGLDVAKTITKTATDTDNYIFNVQSTGNITLNDLKLSGGERAIQNTGGTFTATNVEISECTGMCIRLDGGKANLTNVTITDGKRGLQLYSSANVTGNGLYIYSPSEHGVACGGASTFTIDNLLIDGSTNQALNVYGDSTGTVTVGSIKNTTNNGVDVQDSTVTLKDVDIIFDETLQTGDYSYQGVSANTSGLITLDDVEIIYAPQNGIQLYSGSQILKGSQNVTITSPYSQGIKCGGEGSSFDIVTLNVTNSGDIGLNVFESATGTVKGGYISDSGSYGVNVDNSATVSMTGGAITDSKSRGVNVDNSSTVDLSGLEVKFEEVTGSFDGIYVNNSAQATLTEVTITKAPRYGISVYNGAKVMEESSTVTISSPTNSGIRCGNENSSIDIQDLTVTNSGAYAIEIFGTAKGTVSGGTIKDSANHGVYAYGGSELTVEGVNISFEDVTSGSIDGVHVKDAATIVTMKGGNVTKAPKYGIQVESGKIDLQGTVQVDNSVDAGLYISGSAAEAEINGNVITNGGGRGLVVRQGAKVQKGTNYSKIEITSPTGNGVAVYDSSTLNVGDMTLTKCGSNGIEMRYATPQVTLTGTVCIDSVTERGIRIYQGNLSASDAIINITKPGTFGITASNNTQTIGELNIDGAKGYAAVHADTSANLTINSGHIQNSAQFGVNVNGSATIKIRNCVIENSGSADLQNQASTTATFDLDSTVIYSTGYGKE